ncbi:MAG: protein phosphatase CheZ [Deltaproteobacteria bacterium]|nr:protein phosphatase CheZ [Deltaproteobacteria bacterium]
MCNVVMGNLDGNLDKIAFHVDEIYRIIGRYNANLVSKRDGNGLLLELGGKIYSVENALDADGMMPYFILMNSGIAFNCSEYQILFNIEKFTDDLLSGTDAAGHEHLCRNFSLSMKSGSDPQEKLDIECIDKKLKSGALSQEDVESLKIMIQKLKNGEFFELLTMEFSEKIREVARELIDFRKEIQDRIEPDIVEIASRDIPEASNQLEGINSTLEESTMKIMDINEAQMDLASRQIKLLESLLSENGNGSKRTVLKDFDKLIGALNGQIDVLRKISDKSLSMMQPLSFQDLVGQRIQRIIRLVRSMEARIEELIVSFGIKLKKHREDPTKSYEDLNNDVHEYMSALRGPQRDGQGLDQAGIDELLKSL